MALASILVRPFVTAIAASMGTSRQAILNLALPVAIGLALVSSTQVIALVALGTVAVELGRVSRNPCR